MGLRVDLFPSYFDSSEGLIPVSVADDYLGDVRNGLSQTNCLFAAAGIRCA